MKVMFKIFEYVKIVKRLYYCFGENTAVKFSYMERPGKFDDND